MASVLDRTFLRPMNGLFIRVDRKATSDTSPEMTGRYSRLRGASPSSISVVVDGNSYPATINADGTWSVSQGTISPALTIGQTYDITATATYSGGETVVDRTTDELHIQSSLAAYEAGSGSGVAYGSSASGVAYGFKL